MENGLPDKSKFFAQNISSQMVRVRRSMWWFSSSHAEVCVRYFCYILHLRLRQLQDIDQEPSGVGSVRASQAALRWAQSC